MSNKSSQVVYAAGVLSGVAVSLICIYGFPNISYSLRMTWIDYMTRQDPSLLCNDLETLCGENGAVVSFENQVTPNQIDRSKHLNNSNYVYELNFSRRHFFNSLGLWRVLKSLDSNMVVQCQTIRYRRELKVWQKYRIHTRIIELDETEDCFYLESRFLMDDNFVAAIHHVKYKIVGPKGKDGLRVKISPVKVLQDAGVLLETPKHPVTVRPDGFIFLWEKGNKFSSKQLFQRQ